MLGKLRYILAVLAVGLIVPLASARADDNKEYLVKAAFIYNFVKFVEWPDGRAIAKQSSIDICVLGSSPMNQTGAVFKAASSAKLALKLMPEKSAKNAAGHCHIVFVASPEESHLADTLATLKSAPVLTVSDIDGFAENGGMIGFTTEDNKVKLVINEKAAAAAGLRIDAQLLEIAAKVIQ